MIPDVYEKWNHVAEKNPLIKDESLGNFHDDEGFNCNGIINDVNVTKGATRIMEPGFRSGRSIETAEIVFNAINVLLWMCPSFMCFDEVFF